MKSCNFNQILKMKECQNWIINKNRPSINHPTGIHISKLGIQHVFLCHNWALHNCKYILFYEALIELSCFAWCSIWIIDACIFFQQKNHPNWAIFSARALTTHPTNKDNDSWTFNKCVHVILCMGRINTQTLQTIENKDYVVVACFFGKCLFIDILDVWAFCPALGIMLPTLPVCFLVTHCHIKRNN